MLYRILAGVGVVAVIGLAFWYLMNENQSLQQEIELLELQKLQVESALETTNETLDRLLADQERNQELIANLNESLRAREARLAELRSIFANNDLEELARERGTLIERIINDGTQEAFDELECITNPECVHTNN
jgi:predicted  nucleic acid-binding Zn-ribbon protein